MSYQETKAITVRDALKEGIARLRVANISSFTLAAELLLLHAANRERTWLFSHPDEILPASVAEDFFSLLRRRTSGEPTQHLTGKQEFWGLEFLVTPDVLIPRPETEHLIEVALDRLALRDLRFKHSQNMSGEGLSIADIGTGSGCIAIALAKELPAATIYATDISPKALAIAQQNVARLGFSNRIHFLESNLLDALSSSSETRVVEHAPRTMTEPSPTLDLIISNPPYISLNEAASLPTEVRDHEPAVALFGGEEGYELYAGLIVEAEQFLKPGGLLVLELGHNSLPAVQPLLESPAWTGVLVTNDLANIPRVLSAEKI
jgi:release factor glutamine methyltransferase